MNVEGLRDRLRRAGIEPTPRELAESLWLAAQTLAAQTLAAETPAVPVPVESVAVPPDFAKAVPPPVAAPPVRPALPPLPSRPPDRVELHGDKPAPLPGRRAEQVEVPKPIALGARLAFQRALRPLLRRVPARGIGTLDEDATARLAADHPAGVPWPAVLQPPRELWLDAVVVVDCGDSMAIWRDLAAEVIATLTESGVFRQVARYRLESPGASGTAVLTDWRGRTRRPAQLVDPGNRRVVLVISDCVARMWRTGAAGAMLHEWGRHGPVAILQPLPERLWARSGARTLAGRLAAPRACTPNTGLEFVPYGGRAVPDGTAVPVLELSGQWLRRWTAMIAGGPPGTAAVTVVSGAPVDPPALLPARPLSADQRVRQFRAVASGEAFQLARYVALSEPVLPVIRHVQHAMFRPAQPAHLAEVLLSGLLRVVDSGQGRYRFVEGVPEVLLETLTLSETIQARDLLEKVSASVQRQMSAGRERFTALAPGAGAHDLDEASRPFAIISTLGNRRVALARRRLDRAELIPEVPAGGRTTVATRVPEADQRPGPAGDVDLAGLLAPEAAAIDFRGRDADLSALTAWCSGDGVSVLLLTGAAGAGKTRSAARLVERKRRDGWTVIGARRGTPAPTAPAAGLLVVIDRADVHRDLVGWALQVGGGPVRVLLTARSAGGWWHEHEADDETGLLGAATMHELGPYCPERSQPEFLRLAVADLARRLFPDGPPIGVTPPHLARRGPASPLDIAVTAAWLLLGAGATAVVDGAVERERRYAERSAVRAEISFPSPDALDRYLAAAQLYGADTAPAAREVIRLVTPEGRDAATVRRIATWLHELYPGADGDYWSPLPDALRERLVLSAALPGAEIVRILPEVSLPQARRALATLVPACRAYPSLAEPVWAGATANPALCGAVFDIARAAGGLPEPLLALTRRTMADPGTSVALLRSVADGVDDVGVLFAGGTPGEAERLAAAFERLAAASAPHLPRFADAVYHWGLISERAGREQEALRTGTTEIDLRRRVLAGAGGDEAAAGALARALTGHAVRLDREGSPVAALAAATEAVQLYRRADGGTGPAHALVEHARLLGRLDRSAEALESARQATARYRDLGDIAGLADALLVEAAQARALGRAEAAVGAGAEAVRCYEGLARSELARSEPERYAARYAYACTVHGMDLGDFRSHTAGLARLERGTALYRTLSDRDPRHLPGLAAAAIGRAVLLADLERHDAAHAAFAEVAEIYRGLARTDPPRYAPVLARALTLQAEALADTGGLDAAADLLAEAGVLRDALHAADPLDVGLRAELATGYLILAGVHDRRGDQAAAHECRLRGRLLQDG